MKPGNKIVAVMAFLRVLHRLQIPLLTYWFTWVSRK